MSLDKFVVRRKRKRTEKETENDEQKLKTEKSLEERGIRCEMACGSRSLNWRKITAENLELDYARLFTKVEADNILHELEHTVVYNTGRLAKVQLFGKWIDIPRKQASVDSPKVRNAQRSRSSSLSVSQNLKRNKNNLKVPT